VKYSIPCHDAHHPNLNSKCLPSEGKRRQEDSRGGEKKLSEWVIGFTHIKTYSHYYVYYEIGHYCLGCGPKANC
jgi:hypothetical protein